MSRALLADCFAAAVAAADPARTLPAHLPAQPKGRTIVVGAGKGAAQMAAALEAVWDGPLSGVVVTRYGYGCATSRIKVMEAAHPVPDEAGLRASAALFAAVARLTRDDLVIALICGGGSALLPAPAEGLTLEDEIALNAALLASGAPISAMNALRAQISRIKAGRLALAAHPARVVSLVASDIPGDDETLVSSGPTLPGAVGPRAALALAARWGVALPQRVAALLESGRNAPPDRDDPRFKRHGSRLIAAAGPSLDAAAALAEARGVPAHILTDRLEGEAREAGLFHAALASEIARASRPFAPPVLLLSGGETSVSLGAAAGRGGRNGEGALAMAAGIAGLEVAALWADTDGIDGSGENAGAFVDGTTAARLQAAGMTAETLLAAHDSWRGFDALGDLFAPGPTGVNVNDFRAVLVGEIAEQI